MAGKDRQAYLKAYMEKNKELIAAKSREYYLKNKEQILAQRAAYYLKNSDTIKTQKKEYVAANKDLILTRAKVSYVENRDKRLAKKANYYINNKEAIASKGVVYRKYPENKAKKNAASKFRKLAKIQRTPTWLSETAKWMIDEIYILSALRTQLTGVEWHVDHIIPLHGKKVSGLHIPSNLQVITAKENQIKSNKVGV
jgi:hypothetical protein